MSMLRRVPDGRFHVIPSPSLEMLVLPDEDEKARGMVTVVFPWVFGVTDCSDFISVFILERL